MKIEEFDRVLLNDGRKASIVDIQAGGKLIVADVGSDQKDWETICITIDDIKKAL